MKKKLIAEKYNNMLRLKKVIKEFSKNDFVSDSNNQDDDFWNVYNLTWCFIDELENCHVGFTCSKFYLKNRSKIEIEIFSSTNMDFFKNEVVGLCEKYNLKYNLIIKPL